MAREQSLAFFNAIGYHIRMNQLLFLDFENYYDTHYTLKKLSTSEFIRDGRFQLHGAGTKWGSGETVWTPAEHLWEFLHGIDWKHTTLIAHHAQYDAFILSEIFGIHPKTIHCTLSLSRAIHQGACENDLNSIGIFHEYGGKTDGLEETKGKRDLTSAEEETLAQYCINDVEIMYRFYTDYGPSLSPNEWALIDLTCKMFAMPLLLVDKDRAERARQAEVSEKRDLINNSGTTEQVLASNQQFAEHLKSLGVDPPTKVNAKGKTTWAFAKNDIPFQQLMEVPELVPLIQARLAVKSTITETRAERLIHHCPPGRHLPIYLKYWGAHTGRWSGGDKLNPQNFTRGGELRKSIIAPPGYVIVVIDLSQIEARMLAWWAKCIQLLEAFAQGRDIYSEFASTVFGFPVNRKTNPEHFIEGFVGKVCILGLGYGMGPPKFRLTLASGGMGAQVNISEAQAQATVKLYRRTYREIPELWDQAQNMLHIMAKPRGAASSMFKETPAIPRTLNSVVFERVDIGGKVTLPSGRVLLYPDLWLNDMGDYVYREGNRWKKIYGGLLVENVVQAMARDVIAEQMLTINDKYPIVLSTHDEAGWLAPIEHADVSYEFGMDVMTTVPEWCPGLPLAAEGGYALEYSK